MDRLYTCIYFNTPIAKTGFYWYHMLSSRMYHATYSVILNFHLIWNFIGMTIQLGQRNPINEVSASYFPILIAIAS